jgi:hypothetical protein
MGGGERDREGREVSEAFGSGEKGELEELEEL